MQKTSNNGFGNVYFLNEQAKHHYLDTQAVQKLNEIEISTSDDFNEQFEDWVKERSSKELLLIWGVLNEIQNDSERLENIVKSQMEEYEIPEWLALSGTLAFFSVHYLNKFMIETELSTRGIEFDCYATNYEIALITDGKGLTFNRKFLQDLKNNIYEDQLNKGYFTELADAITALTVH